MSHKVFARDCETMPELTAWTVGHIPTASLHLLDGEVIIHTGMTVEMNGELMPLSDEETCPSEGDIPIQFCTCERV